MEIIRLMRLSGLKGILEEYRTLGTYIYFVPLFMSIFSHISKDTSP